MTESTLRRLFPAASESFIKENAVAANLTQLYALPAQSSLTELRAQISKVSVSFRINVTPRSVQFGKRMGLNKKTGKMLMFCDKKTKQFYEEVTLAASEFAPPVPLEGPLHVRMAMFFPRPQRLMGQKSPDGPIWMPSRPDAENCFKGVADPLTKLNFWNDDAQIVHQEALKWYCPKGDVPHIIIQINEL